MKKINLSLTETEVNILLNAIVNLIYDLQLDADELNLIYDKLRTAKHET